MDIVALNQRFSLDSMLRFIEDPSGLVVIEIDNPLATASICLQGAHLLTWQPHSCTEPVIWQSESVRLVTGKSPHCGAPVCWPWFGAHEDGGNLPAHGYVRNLPWEVADTASMAGGATCITLRLAEPGGTPLPWPRGVVLELAIVVGDTLRLALTTRNSGPDDMTIGEALHTYFQVGDISQAGLQGLDGITYADKVAGFVRSVQHGPVTFSGETDRVYLDTAGDCVIEDPVLHRRIRVAKSGSDTTVVWNPWQEKGDKLGDLGTAGWRHMLCVESANAMENRVAVSAGTTHTLAVEYSVEAL